MVVGVVMFCALSHGCRPHEWMESYCTNSSNHMNQVGQDSVCRPCSPFDCLHGQYGVTCTNTSDSSCADCSNYIPDYAHWTSEWDDTQSPVKCLWKCNDLFDLLPGGAGGNDTCVCMEGYTLFLQPPNAPGMVPPAKGQCRKCKVCAPGERVLSPCTSTHDTVCTPCSEATSFALAEPVHHFKQVAVCKDTGIRSPNCVITFENVEAEVELSVSMVMTDFSNYDEYITGIFVGDGYGSRVGGNYLRSIGKDNQCQMQKEILSYAPISPSAINSKKQLRVHIKASYSVGSVKCAYDILNTTSMTYYASPKAYTLIAYVTISRARAHWDHDAISGPHYDAANDLCVWQCDAGFQKSLNGTECVCDDGFYVSDGPDAVDGCAPCSTCRLHGVRTGSAQLTLEQCSLTKDTVCADCCNEKPAFSYFTGEFSTKTGVCEWRCNDGFYKARPPRNDSNHSLPSTTSHPNSTIPVTTPAPQSNETLPWACKYVFDGSVPGEIGSGVAYGEPRICLPCTVCVDGTYQVSPCADTADTICKICPNQHPDNAHYLGSVSNHSGTIECDWECDSGYLKDEAGSLCEVCKNPLRDFAYFTGESAGNGFCESRCNPGFHLATSQNCVCNSGSYFSGSQCVNCTQCEIGTYARELCTQSTNLEYARDTSCLPCFNQLPLGAEFTGEGRVMSNATHTAYAVSCDWQCVHGYFYNNSGCQKCTKCAAGTYQSHACVSGTAPLSRDTNCSACPNHLPQYANFTRVFNEELRVCEWQCQVDNGFILNSTIWFSHGAIIGLKPASVPTPPGGAVVAGGGAVGDGGEVGMGPPGGGLAGGLLSGAGAGGPGPGANMQAKGGAQEDLIEVYTGPCRCPELEFYLHKGVECRRCAVCERGSYTVRECNATANRICRVCPNAKPLNSEYTGMYDETLGECEWKCNPDFEPTIVQDWRSSRVKCTCMEGKICYQCPALPKNAGLLDVCQLFTDPSTGVCTFNERTVAGVVLAVLMPMTSAEFDSNRIGITAITKMLAFLKLAISVWRH